MLADSIEKMPYSGKLDSGVHLPCTAKVELVEFIAAELPRWRDDPERPHPELAETKLTEHLCDYLNGAAYNSTTWSHVQFRTETSDESCAGRKIDLTVKPRTAALIIEGRRFTKYQALFPIECKRLPTPAGKDRDKREYVTNEPGTTGGIQRFKFGYHGAAHNFGALIGYVQGALFSDCLNEINKCINELAADPNSAWLTKETLKSLAEDLIIGICAFESEVVRPKKSDTCTLRHLWIRMN